MPCTHTAVGSIPILSTDSDARKVYTSNVNNLTTPSRIFIEVESVWIDRGLINLLSGFKSHYFDWAESSKGH